MSLDSLNLSHLPRPPRSPISCGPESTRATLPNFANVDELGQFLNRLFNWRLTTPGILLQLKIAAGILLFGVVVVLAILCKRRIIGNFLPFRLVRKPRGTILVPNTMLAFPFSEGMLAILLSTYLLSVCKHQSEGTGLFLNFWLWILMIWITLIYGMVWAIVGTYFAIPDAMESPLSQNDRSWLQRAFSIPIIFNLASTVLPMIISTLEAVPALIGNSQWNKAHQMEKDWQLKYATSLEFTPELVQASQRIWFEAIKAMKYISIAFFGLAIIAWGLGVVYLYISCRLIRTIRADLRKTVAQDCSTINKNGATISELIRTATEALKDHKTTEKGEDNLSPQPPRKAQSSLGKTSRLSKSNSALSRRTTNEIQKKSLRLALIHIYIQLLAIAPGAAGLGGISLSCALTMYGKFEQPGQDGGVQVEYSYSIILLTAIWLICAAGAQTLLAIAFKTYEFVFTTKSVENGQNGVNQADGRGPSQSTFFETQTRAAAARRSILGDDKIIEEEEEEEEEEEKDTDVRFNSKFITQDSLLMTPISRAGWSVEVETDVTSEIVFKEKDEEAHY